VGTADLALEGDLPSVCSDAAVRKGLKRDGCVPNGTDQAVNYSQSTHIEEPFRKRPGPLDRWQRGHCLVA